MVRGLLASLALAGLIALPAVAKVSGSNGRILYGNEAGVFTANPDGSDSQLLEPDAGGGSWSPDGSLIALAVSTADGRITTATVRPDGSGYQALPLPGRTMSLGPASVDSWSPDGKRLALQGWDTADASRLGVYTVSSGDGSGLVRVTSNPYGSNDVPEDWSPDGAWILFNREDPARHDRFADFVVRANGGPAYQIGGWQRDFGAASWSPDGRWILSDDRGGLYVVHPDGSGRRRIPIAVGGRAFAFTPGWSPDGRKIVFALFEATPHGGGQEAIYTANADGSDLRSTGLQGAYPDWGTDPTAP
jgi:Tol biopolymer transport system component